MLRLASFSVLIAFILCALQKLGAQNWQPAMDGIYPTQWNYPDYFDIKFKNNILGKEWIYGTWLDEDSIRRGVAYREGGEWVPLPITFPIGGFSKVKDIALWGDTLLIGGQFNPAISDLDSTQTYSASLLKWWNDSLWSDPFFHFVEDIDVSGDSILIWAGYASPTDTLGYLVFKHDTLPWQNVGNPVHPTETWGFFGAFADLQIHNGQIYTVNNGSPPNDSAGWKGIVRWDGTQWHPYPYGLWGGWARATALEFYRNELFMGGTFFKSDHPYNPGNGIAKWDGTQWTSMGGGVGGFVIDLFLHDSLLYSFISNSGFADAPISYFAAWNGHQWCGTPGNFARPPISFGFANDTLFCTFNEQSTTIGTDTVTHMNYFVGNYVNGPNAVCSTYDLGDEEHGFVERQLIISPNPFTTSATIELGEGNYNVMIMDVTGRIVRAMNGVNGNVIIERGNMKAGIYMMTVTNDKGYARTSKFVVE
jgi:hypothetical protein